MSLWTMPIIVLNMGGEMIYILHQRLQAQTVQDEKAKKVLQDVVRAMFSPLFITELFKPQEMYTANSTKQIFEKLAHSSIMRLNKSSMEKLYDLMTMGFKYQLISCASPEQFMHVTLNHLETIKRILRSCSTSSTGGGVALDLVEDASEKVLATYTVLSKGNWFLLRQSLMSFLQGKRIKVSLFLQQGMQGLDGVLALSNRGTMPFGTEAPGTVRYFDGRSCVKERKISLLPTEEGESDELKICSNIIDTESRLGLNLFSKDTLPPPTEGDVATITRGVESLTATIYHNHLGSNASTAIGAMDSKVGADDVRSGAKITQTSAKAELSMLSDLLGMGLGDAGSKSSGGDEKPFKINLFPDNNFDSDSKSDRGGMITIDIDASVGTKTVSSYMNELGLKDDGSAKAGAKNEEDEEEDDLLAMMDSAASK